MSLERPESLSEWRDYIAMQSGESLRSQARAANSWSFVQQLQSENTPPEVISEIFWLLAAQFVQTGQMPPSDGYTDLAAIARTCPKLKPLYESLE